MAKILVIDDEPDVLVLIKNILEKDHIVTTSSCADSVDIDTLNQYDLILLDIMMPGTDGLSFCKKIRHRVQCPILFLTAKSREADIVESLISGGDDYITKPFGIQELQARIHAHLRREQRENHAILNRGEFRFNLSSKEVFIGEQKVKLTKSEYEICEYLAKHKGQVFSREQIYDGVYGYEGESDPSSISEHIKNIRGKFSNFGLSPIATVWGIGYKWI
ncbi:MAG: response regulator transcription factor [Tissierellia bacterium]|nr:response regulator transcription factor [Tissierellia bacterium]